MSFSLPVVAEPDFNLFAMTHDLRYYLQEHYAIPVSKIEHVFLWGERIDFSLREVSLCESVAPWYQQLMLKAA
ncbi:MAG: hypothetical protein JXK05_13085 [Campylobacterales bacterium]|nr:hypothetical protein [Campylobacterales bacterium]